MLYFVKMLCAAMRFLLPGITPVVTNPNSLANIEQDGLLVPGGPLINALASLSNNAAPAFGNFSQTLIPSSLNATTYAGGQLVGGIIRRLNNAGALTTDSTDTATNIVNAIPGASPLQTFPVFVANMGSGSLTLAGGTGVTMAGTNTIAGFSMRLFLGQVTGSAAVTLTGLFAFPLSSSL